MTLGDSAVKAAQHSRSGLGLDSVRAKHRHRAMILWRMQAWLAWLNTEARDVFDFPQDLEHR